MQYLGLAAILLVVWGVVWMWRVGRSGPPWLDALAETAVFLALPVGPFLWLALPRTSRFKQYGKGGRPVSHTPQRRQPRNLAIIGLVMTLLGLGALAFIDAEPARAYGTITGGLIVASVGGAWSWATQGRRRRDGRS